MDEEEYEALIEAMEGWAVEAEPVDTFMQRWMRRVDETPWEVYDDA